MKETRFIWKNGELIDWHLATTHVLTHGLHYGTGVFEGIRAYKTDNGTAVFRLDDHMERLHNSAKIIQMPLPYSVSELTTATIDLIRQNKLDTCYIRPLCYYGYGEMGLNPQKNPVDTIIAAWEWGTYLGEEGLEKGIRCKMSSWARLDSRISPPLAKSTANYLNSALAKREALSCGFDEAIMLGVNGTIAEGPGENLFVVKNGSLITNHAADNALVGITANTVKWIANYLGIPVVQQPLIRDELFIADELFFSGTAAEITPIREIDGRMIGSGKRGPITKKIQSTYFQITGNQIPDSKNWLTFI